MESIIEKAEILLEALPFIRNFRGKTFVIKYGGNAMDKADLRDAFAQDIIMLKYIGINPVIVQLINSYSGGHVKAVGITGKDGCLIKAKKLDAEEYLRSIGDYRPTELLDLGHVGEVEEVNPELLIHLDEDNYIPVIAPIGFDAEGNAYNINADFVAAAIAGALKAEKVLFLTDIEGLKDENGNTLSSATVSQINQMIKDGVIKGGMIPKVKACIQALEKGVNKAHILDGRLPHCILLEIFTKKGVGTEITL